MSTHLEQLTARRRLLQAMRVLSSVHEGRVDPRLVGFDYDVSTKRLDLAAALRSTRDAGGLSAAIAAAEPRFRCTTAS